MIHSSLDRCSATMPQPAVSPGSCRLAQRHYGDGRACRKARHVHDSGTWHLNLETLVDCLDRTHQDVRKCGVPSVFGPTAGTELQDDPAQGGRAGLRPPWRVFVFDGRCKVVGSAFVMPKLHRVTRLPKASRADARMTKRLASSSLSSTTSEWKTTSSCSINSP